MTAAEMQAEAMLALKALDGGDHATVRRLLNRIVAADADGATDDDDDQRTPAETPEQMRERCRGEARDAARMRLRNAAAELHARWNRRRSP